MNLKSTELVIVVVPFMVLSLIACLNIPITWLSPILIIFSIFGTLYVLFVLNYFTNRQYKESVTLLKSLVGQYYLDDWYCYELGCDGKYRLESKNKLIGAVLATSKSLDISIEHLIKDIEDGEDGCNLMDTLDPSIFKASKGDNNED